MRKARRFPSSPDGAVARALQKTGVSFGAVKMICSTAYHEKPLEGAGGVATLGDF